MKERILAAYKVADKLALEYSGGSKAVPEEEQLVLDKWIEQGLVTYVKQKKGDMSRRFYFPVLCSKEWEGLSGGLWLQIMHYVMNNNDFTSGLSSNSVSEYVNRKYKYNIEHGVETSHYLGPKHCEAEQTAWDEIKKELKDGKR